MKAPDLMLQDTLRRYGVTSAGVFGTQPRLAAGSPSLSGQVAKFIVDEHVRRHRVDKLLRIIELLLEFEADPNAGHSYPVPGRTPLMLAAESDLPEAFDLMVRHGGKPMQPDASGANCMRIALAFGSGKVVRYLKTTRI
ncbi:ankyrin repeat domain-containing protein [Ralstonia pseudosolanacearum]|uniref:ankyrin repeat domain-containing protein n=1 Tax=Ralstonia pseudosolanacearum TaxID=1310165 RepID=UPI003D2EE908